MTIKKILEKLTQNTMGNPPYRIDTALALIKQAYENCVPKEIEIPTDVCGVKVTIAEAYGHNACRIETLKKMENL